MCISGSQNSPTALLCVEKDQAVGRLPTTYPLYSCPSTHIHTQPIAYILQPIGLFQSITNEFQTPTVNYISRTSFNQPRGRVDTHPSAPARWLMTFICVWFHVSLRLCARPAAVMCDQTFLAITFGPCENCTENKPLMNLYIKTDPINYCSLCVETV